MINIKKFIDRVTSQQNKGGRDVVLSLDEAQMLKDEVTKLLVDRLAEAQVLATQPVNVEVKGGKW